MKLSLVVPVYNEEETIQIFYETVRNYKPLAEHSVEIIFVNDGSVDATEYIINEIAKADDLVKVYSFIRNFGQNMAICCGIDHATGDCIIPMVVDLQDPIEIIPKMLEKIDEGADLVLGKRIDRSSDTFVKRFFAKLYYWLLNKVSPVRIEKNVSNCCCITRKVVERFKTCQEKNVFLSGLFNWIGGNNVKIVDYVRPHRSAGTSKFTLEKLIGEALDGFVCFSNNPLRVCLFLGVIIIFICLICGIWLLVQRFVFDMQITNFVLEMLVILFFGGIQLVVSGILGEYIGRIFVETKSRPRYILK